MCASRDRAVPSEGQGVSLAEPRLLTGREGLVQRNTSSCSREMFDYVIRSKRVGVRAESLSMFSSEKRLRTDIILFLQVFSYS